MLELRHRALLKNKFGKKKRKQDMILEEKNLWVKYGTGKMNMDKKLIINLRDLEYLSIGIDLPLLWTKPDLKQSLKHTFECSIKD
jgi:hypothetical protein